MPVPHAIRSRSCAAAPRRAARGFTLMELMVSVVIVAILAAIAIPSYREYVVRSRIVDATTALSDYRVRMEQFFLDNRRYLTDGACGVPETQFTTESFDITCAAGGSAQSYVVTATGKAGRGMSGFVYTLTQDVGANNLRATTSTGSWGKSSATCWVVRKDGSCG